MFVHDSSSSIQLSGSPSLLLNNLSSSSSDSLCYVRSNEVFVVQTAGESLKLPLPKAKIYQANFITICNTSVVAVLSSLGLQIWSITADAMIFHYPINDFFENGNTDEKYMRGVVATLEYLCVGTSMGTVSVFNCSNLAEGNDFPLVHNIITDPGIPISSIAASSTQGGGGAALLAVGNDDGKLLGFRADEAFVEVFAFAGYGHPATALAIQGSVLIAAYSSGHIRLFRTDVMELTVELTAHTRIITGLAVASDGESFVSCSQDQYVHVWTLPDFRSRSGCDVIKLHSQWMENKICTGVASLSKDRFAVACYDDEEVAVFRKD